MGKTENRRIPSICAVCALALVMALCVGDWLYTDNLAYESFRVEAGTVVEASCFLKSQDENAYFTADSEPFDTAVPGEYRVKVKSGLFIYSCTLLVVDTTPPEAEVHDVEDFVTASMTPEDFITSVEDVTKVTAAFLVEPDVTLAGTQDVTIVFTDECGNVTEKHTALTLISDTVPPVIEGVVDLTVYIGDSVAYKKNVTVTDDYSGDVTLTVDSSGVDLDTAGTYSVTYTATDASGNTSSATANVTVIARTYEDETVYALADQVLDSILTDGMTDRDKAEAIFNYITSHVSYIDHTDKGDYLKAAYEALQTGRGDCYAYASLSQLLLTRADIKNMMIAKIPSSSSHYWNLVDVGDGWYHFDTTPRRAGHPRIFLWTEAELMEYSDAHNGSHNYDHSVYPAVN